MSDSRWYFTEEQLANSPSRKCGINAEIELSYRQRAANLIQEMGQRLQVSQLCINTAIVYMHRFYAFHSFTMFHRNTIAAASFFLAAKVEEQPRKLEHVIKILNICLEKTDMTRDTYTDQAQELVLNENILLQTLGFDVAIDHPHTHVVKACQLFNIVTVSRELRQTCYFMASNSLHLTTMCLKYRPTVVAAFCIYIACKWSRWEIPDSSEGKAWYSYVDETVTLDTLKKLTEEYLQILDRSPSKFKSKMKSITSNGQAGLNQSPGISDGPSTSHHKAQHHDKHNHHHHHHKSASMSSSSATNSMSVNSNGNSRSSSKAQMHQMSSNSSSSQFKPVPTSQSGASQSAASSSNHNMHRPRPPVSSSQPPYPTNKPLMDERAHQQQQRLMHQDANAYYNAANHPKLRLSSSNPPPLPPQQQPPLPQQQQQQQPPQPYMKLGINDQKQQHNLMGNSSKQLPPYPPQGMDMHQKNMKQDYHSSRSSSNSLNPQMNQQIPNNNNPQKKQQPPWPQQQSSMSQQLSSHNQDKQQYQHLQKNLQMPNNVLDQNASKSMSNYDMTTSKQQSQQHATNMSQNDFWFNDKINEMSSNSPPRLGKSLFSPSPEHDSGTNEKAKYMMVTGSLKRQSNDNVDSPKDDIKKSSTPTKRERSMLANASKQNIPQLPMPIPSSHIDKKFSSKMESILNSNPPLPHLDIKDPLDSSQSLKKRSYSSIKDTIDSSQNRENKIRKVDVVKSEPSVPSSLPVTPSHSSLISSKITQQQSLSNPPSIYGATTDQTSSTLSTKQPIETNPDIVKSLLQECFSSNKYDAFDADVIYPEPPEELFATTTVSNNSSSNNNNNNNNNSKNSSNNNQQQQTVPQPALIKHEPVDDLLDIKDEKMDSSAGEGSRKDHKKKSKKKKEKHKHKKKHKSSDRDEKSDSSSLKIIISKDGKSDSKSSPESHAGGIKIKIPINKDTAAAVPTVNVKNEVNPAPIKLKISKGSFTNINSNPANTSSTSTTSSHHHHKSKKDKDREKSKSSKHHNSSDYKEGSSSYQHST